MSPFEALILKATGNPIVPSTPVPLTEPDYDPLAPQLEPPEPKPPTATFVYSNDKTVTLPFPRKPAGLTKLINGRFERPIRVRFRNMDPDFKPKNAANLAAWKTSCQLAVQPHNPSSIDLES